MQHIIGWLQAKLSRSKSGDSSDVASDRESNQPDKRDRIQPLRHSQITQKVSVQVRSTLPMPAAPAMTTIS